MPDKRQEQFDLLMGRISSHLPPEKVEQLKGIFTEAPEAALQLGEEVLAKSDYTRSIQQVQQDRQQLQQEKEQLTALSTKVNEYDQYLQQNYLPREDYEKVLAERNQFQSRFDQLSQSYPSLLEELELTPSKGETTIMPNQPAQPGGVASVVPPQNPIRNVTELQFNQANQNLAALSILSPAAQHDLAVRHQKLYGQPLENMTEIVQETASTGKSLEEVWASKYNVAEQLKKLENERIEQLVSERVNAEVSAKISASVAGGAIGIPNNGTLSPFLQRLSNEQASAPGNGVVGAPDPNRIANQGTGQGTAAQNATAAYLSGKYKDERFSLISA